jgi:RHS repeat-associated protein
VGWRSRGKTGVNLTLYHNSKGVGSGQMGPKWCTSYDVYIYQSPNPLTWSDSAGTHSTLSAIVRWPDGTYEPFRASPYSNNYLPPAGFHETLTLNPATSVWTLTKPNQTVFRFSGAYLTSITDRDNNVITVSRAPNHRVNSVADSNGRSLVFRYTTDQYLTSVQDPNQNLWTFSYSPTHQMTGITSPAVTLQYPTYVYKPYKRQFAYDSNNNIVTETDHRGHAWGATYSASNQQTSFTDPLGNVVYFSYQPSYTTFSLPEGGQYQHNYSTGALASTVDPEGYPTNYQWDSSRNMTRIVDRARKYYYFGFDARGKVISIRTPLETNNGQNLNPPYVYHNTFTYSAQNDLLTASNPFGHVTTYGYDQAHPGRLTSIMRTSGPSVSSTLCGFGYNAYGQVTSIHNTDGSGWDFQYDPTTANLSYAHQLGGDTFDSFSYDANSNLTAVHSATLGTFFFTLDEWYRPIQVTLPGSAFATRRVAYDEEGNATYSADENSHSSSAIYDAADRQVSCLDPNGYSLLYSYDHNSRLTSFTNGRSRVTSYGYTLRGDVKQLTLPDGATSWAKYDGNGNETWFQDKRFSAALDPGGPRLQMSYDDVNRLTSVAYVTTVPNSSTTLESYTYDPERLTSMSNGNGTTNWTYDLYKDVVTSVVSPQGSTMYDYDSVFRRAHMWDSASPNAVANAGPTTYGYDTFGRLQQITNPFGQITSWHYDDTKAGRLDHVNYSNGTYSAYGYDGWNRVNAINHCTSTGSSFRSEAYIQDNVGNFTQATLDNVVRHYAYDNANQLIQESTPSTGSHTDYVYDGNGNRTSKTVDGALTSFVYDSGDKLTSQSAAGIVKSYQYDNAGNLTQVSTGSAVTAQYFYDYEGRMVQAQTGDQGSAYNYNPMGARVLKYMQGVLANSYLRDGAGAGDDVVADSNAVYTSQISELRNGSTRFMHHDVRGSVIATTDSSQTQTSTLNYDAFGSLSGATGTTVTPFKYVGAEGYQGDSETGLQLLGHRYYDPSLGRFITRDPAMDGNNWYAYCQNNPMLNTDPLGLHGAADSVLYREGYDSDGSDWRFRELVACVAKAVNDLDNSPEVRAAKERAATDFAYGVFFAAMGGIGEIGAEGNGSIDAEGSVADAPMMKRLSKSAQLAANKAVGDGFRDEVLAALLAAGKDARPEIQVQTKLGARRFDIGIFENDVLTSAVETKVGSSGYSGKQLAKDNYLRIYRGMNIDIVRKP